MDWRALARRSRRASLALLAGCASSLAPLGPGERAVSAPVGIEPATVGSRGAIGYEIGFLGPRLLLSVELGVRFELVIRRVDAGALAELGRVDLGPPDWDVTSLVVPQVGPRVWITSTDGTVREIDVGRQRVSRTWRVGQAVTAATSSADGRYLVYGTDRGVLCLRRARDGALLQCLRAHHSRISALAIDGDALASASWGGEVARFELPSLERTAGLTVAGAVNDLAIHGDRLALAVSSEPAIGDRRRTLDGALIVLDLASGARHRCDGHQAPVSAVRWTSRGIISGSWDRSVRAWRVEGDGCKESWRAVAGGHQITALAGDARGRYLAVASWVTTLEQPGALLLRYLYPSGE